jgi:hypothetical protein
MGRRLTLLNAATIVLAVTLADAACAQTLVDPSSRTAPSPAPPPAKSRASAKVKSCSEYGAGFVNIPGTDACIKTGGTVRVETGINRGQ